MPVLLTNAFVRRHRENRSISHLLEAAAFGALGASALLVGAGLTYWLRPSRVVIGYVMAVGAGTLISAVAFELVLDIIEMGRPLQLATGLSLGALAFFYREDL